MTLTAAPTAWVATWSRTRCGLVWVFTGALLVNLSVLRLLQCVVVCTCMSCICCMLVNPPAHPLLRTRHPALMTCHALPCLRLSYCVRRAIRKLVTNNKRRHSLILALHAAGSGNGYGDLGNVYDAVKGMHDGLAAGTGWNTEAGALCLKWATYVLQAHSPPTWSAERLVQELPGILLPP